jgi:hypothetical protein
MEAGRPATFPIRDSRSPFSPPHISGLEYWFDAQDSGSLFQDDALSVPAVADLQPVGGWKDRANARNVTQANGSLKPLFRTAAINGRPAVEADGVDDYLRASGVSLTQPLSIYCVSNLGAANANMTWFDGSGLSTERVRILTSATAQFSINAGAGLNDGASDISPHVHSAIFNGASSLYAIDGVVAASGNSGVQPLVGLTLFANRSNLAGLAGCVGELLMYSGAHSDPQRLLVEHYLRTRWGI